MLELQLIRNVYHRYIRAFTLVENCTKTKIYDVHLKLQLVLPSKAKDTAVVLNRGAGASRNLFLTFKYSENQKKNKKSFINSCSRSIRVNS